MRKLQIDESDKLVLMSFIKAKDPKFIRVLNLELVVDYFMGNCLNLINRRPYLNTILYDVEPETKREINNYINKYGEKDDIIFFYKLKLVYLILDKYYHSNGTAKEIFLSS